MIESFRRIQRELAEPVTLESLQRVQAQLCGSLNEPLRHLTGKELVEEIAWLRDQERQVNHECQSMAADIGYDDFE